jgi:hypothetical protein
LPRSDDNPELNPLTNPVLSANMGRWAEVYVTTPPEERDEAVLELLRELRAEASQASQPAAKAKDNPGSLPSADENSIACRSCGQNNPAQDRFCGQCGADLLLNRSLSSPFFDPEPERRALAGVSEGDRNPFGEDWVPDEGPRLIPDYEPTPYRYRVYAGAAMAVLVSALVYVAWRGTQRGFGGSHALPAAVPAAAPETSRQPQATPAPKRDTTAASNHVSEPGARTTGGSPSANDSSEINSESKTASAAMPARAGAAAKPAPPVHSARGNGSEELTIAENYLNGTQGKAQDRAEAAKWLWRSVAKQNSRAAVMLSDLYLQGNGVAKSCDQARLLLDSAARKGAAGASERLRNLPAFGCR